MVLLRYQSVSLITITDCSLPFQFTFADNLDQISWARSYCDGNTTQESRPRVNLGLYLSLSVWFGESPFSFSKSLCLSLSRLQLRDNQIKQQGNGICRRNHYINSLCSPCCPNSAQLEDRRESGLPAPEDAQVLSHRMLLRETLLPDPLMRMTTLNSCKTYLTFSFVSQVQPY